MKATPESGNGGGEGMHERIADEKRMRRGGHDLSKGELVYVSADFLVIALLFERIEYKESDEGREEKSEDNRRW